MYFYRKNIFSMKKLLRLSCITFMFAACTSTENNQHKQHTHEHDTTSPMENIWKDCQNCGMPTNDFKNWQVRIHADDKSIAFCTPRCMLMFLADSSVHKVDSVWVTDYYTTQKIDGKNAFYVTGSDKTSPMGKDFVPFATQTDAEAFLKDHNGKKIYSFLEINRKTVVEELK